MSLQVCIMTPQQLFWDDKAEEIILPTNSGKIGILENHAPVITAIDVGAMFIKTKQNWISIVLMGGFALVKQNQITVLVNGVESGEEIDTTTAENDFNNATTKLDQAKDQKQRVEARFEFKLAKARYMATVNKPNT